MKEFACNCTEHSLVVSRIPLDEDNPSPNDHDEFEISVWYYGHQYYSVSQRLRHIWRILRHGHPWADMIVLNRETATQLRDYLTQELGEL